jgi:hypothetical protein
MKASYPLAGQNQEYSFLTNLLIPGLTGFLYAYPADRNSPPDVELYHQNVDLSFSLDKEDPGQWNY